jgi:amino-acid N-acetyltransferase
MTIRPAQALDLPGILQMLRDANLPSQGVSEHLDTFLVAQSDTEIVGTIGLELYGDIGLLRSAAVRESHRSSGVGTLLYERLRELAASQGVRSLVLLTTTAEKYFARKGFAAIDPQTLAGSILTSSEFTGACPSTAVCMEQKL